MGPSQRDRGRPGSNRGPIWAVFSQFLSLAQPGSAMRIKHGAAHNPPACHECAKYGSIQPIQRTDNDYYVKSDAGSGERLARAKRAKYGSLLRDR